MDCDSLLPISILCRGFRLHPYSLALEMQRLALEMAVEERAAEWTLLSRPAS